MKKIIFLFFIVFLFLSCNREATVKADETGGKLSGQYFSLEVRQNGVILPIKDHNVTLEKAPFDLIFNMEPNIGLLVNFSTESRMYDGFKAGMSLPEILDEPDMFMGMAESSFNPDEMIALDPMLPHYFFYGAEDYHRFDSVTWVGERIEAVRHVERYSYPGDWAESIFYNLKDIPFSTIYVSILYSEWSADYKRIEMEKQWLELKFKD